MGTGVLEREVMAQRRMFSPDIVESDAFLEMPASTQALYFHFGMNADDDGFVQPKKIMRIVGCQEDDIKILIAKRFVLPFESGVVVIKHWLVHNMLRADRYKETTYQQEKSMLGLNEYRAYTEKREGVLKIPTIKKNGEKPEWLKRRIAAFDESPLPNSFDYKIRSAFYGKECPICTNLMMDISIEEKGYDSKYKPLPSIQHNIPLSKGGKHELGNISVICQSCNLSLRNVETGDLNSQEVIEVWQSIGNQSATQDRLGKDRLGKELNTSSSTDVDVDVYDIPGFKEFWDAYPNKRGKGQALKTWKKLKPGKTLQSRILKSIEDHKLNDRQWKRDGGQYIPHPSTFLNSRRFDDVISIGSITSTADKF